MKNQELYLECFSGISGDMMLGALLDLGADEEGLMALIQSLPLTGYRIRRERTRKKGIDAYGFHVDLEPGMELCTYDSTAGEQAVQGSSRGANLNQEEGHSHSHGEEHILNHEEGHSHSHGEEHSHNQDGAHVHSHVHRTMKDIRRILEQMEAPGEVKATALRIFEILAEAEAKAHGVAPEEVHFHEVGAVDSLIDIVGTSYCLWSLGIQSAYLSPLYEGQGHVRCAHGLMPVPVPAVQNIAQAEGLRIHTTQVQGEMVTPTGAAIAAALNNHKTLPDSYRVLAVGVGAGEKEFPQANILRASLISAEKNEKKLWVLETNMDDVTGEALGYTMEKLMAAGARDVYYTPIYMKKSRPAYLLRVMCMEEDIPAMERLIFRHTTTIGIRRYPVERTVLPREIQLRETEFGPVRVKVCDIGEGMRAYPEYEDVKRICEEQGLGYTDVFRKILL